MLRTIGIALSAVAAFFAVFVVALHVHFPGKAARERLAWEIQEASGGAWLVEAADASLYRGTGVALDDVVLYKRDVTTRRRAGDEAAPTVPVLRMERAAARARILPLLAGNRSAAFGLDLYGGELDGDLSLTATTQRLRLDGADIDLSRIPLEGEEWTVDATGKLAITGDITLGTEDVKESAGSLRLEIADLVFQQATIMGMTLEPTPFTEAVLAFEIDEGRAEVTQGRFTSEPVDITVSGEISLNRSLERSRVKLDVEVRFSEQFDRLAKMAPNLSAARDDEGVYHFKVSGTLKSPRFREDRMAKGSRSVTPTRRPAAGDDEEAEVLDDEDAEKRRAERRERIRDRRKRMMDRRSNREAFDEPGIPPLPGQLGDMPDDLDLPRAIDSQRFRDREEILDVGIDEGDLPPEQDFEDELPPMDEELPPDEGSFDEEF